MDTHDLQKEKQLLESRIDSLLTTFLNEHKEVKLQGLDIEIQEVQRPLYQKIISVRTSISLSL